MVVPAYSVTLEPKAVDVLLIVIVLLDNLLLAIEPASIVLVTVPVSPDVMAVPVVAGSVNTVPVPAVAAGIICTVPDVVPGNVTLEMPVSARLAEARFNAIAVVPTYRVELPNTPVGIVPDKLPAVRLVRLAPDTAPNEPDQVPDVIVPTVAKLASEVSVVLLDAVMLAAVPVVF